MRKSESNNLFEAEPDELDLLEFIIAGDYFGINVTSVRELIPYQKVLKIPHSRPGIEGVIRSRDMLYTVVNLPQFFDFPSSADPMHDILIVTDYNTMNLAFHVHMVVGIRRVSTEIIEKTQPFDLW